ncbi:DUF1642 domain-containing protein [Lacticaseibacillus suibinensis]|uniref:DUF1642 domain-containing protein n=1 Tax=Lacticaseibacillus suibinensis TaxID=2486011 RepID=UPI001940F308|nr:DUF1642 domain-containing protein [Lacticaseibacillus suibinensis]
MSLYAVKNDKGEWWDFEAYDGFWSDGSCECAVTAYQERADSVIKEHGGHVVELVEAPAKVVVSEKEADKLERAKFYGNPADVILALAANHHPDDAERLLRAYVIGLTVEKPKRYGVWVPHVKGKMYFKDGRGNDGLDIASADCLNEANQQFTAAEIEHYGLQDCEKTEVSDD